MIRWYVVCLGMLRDDATQAAHQRWRSVESLDASGLVSEPRIQTLLIPRDSIRRPDRQFFCSRAWRTSVLLLLAAAAVAPVAPVAPVASGKPGRAGAAMGVVVVVVVGVGWG